MTTKDTSAVESIVEEYVKEFGELEIGDTSGKTIPVSISQEIPNWLRTTLHSLLQAKSEEILAMKKPLPSAKVDMKLVVQPFHRPYRSDEEIFNFALDQAAAILLRE